jgi:hypothetical protein
MVVGVVLDVVDILGYASLQIILHNYFPLVQRIWD